MMNQFGEGRCILMRYDDDDFVVELEFSKSS